MIGMLPDGFGDLEPFAGAWSGMTAADRAALRDEASPAGAAAFYAAVRPLLEPALDHLDAKPLADHDDREQRLIRLLLTYAHVATGIEIQREDEPGHAALRKHMRLVRAPADEQV